MLTLVRALEIDLIGPYEQAEARMAVFDHLEGFYNPRRRHSALDYKSPIEYERTRARAA